MCVSCYCEFNVVMTHGRLVAWADHRYAQFNKSFSCNSNLKLPPRYSKEMSNCQCIYIYSTMLRSTNYAGKSVIHGPVDQRKTRHCCCGGGDQGEGKTGRRKDTEGERPGGRGEEEGFLIYTCEEIRGGGTH